MVILLIIVFVQVKLAVMHQRDHFVCLYLKTWRVRVLLFPSPIPFKFQNFVNYGPAQFQQVLQKIIGCRTYMCILNFFFKKSVAVGNWESLSSIIHTIPHLTNTVAVSTLNIFYATCIQHISHNSSFNTGTSHTVSHLIVTQTSSVV